MAVAYICRRCGGRRLPPPHDWAVHFDIMPGSSVPYPGGLEVCGDLHDFVEVDSVPRERNWAIETATRDGRAIAVTRHQGAIEWLAAHLGGTYDAQSASIVTEAGLIPVKPSVDISDVRDKVVIGNLPMALAQYAREVWAIEFVGTAPRGAEYSAADMEAAGARLSWYVVLGSGVPLSPTELDTVLLGRDASFRGIPPMVREQARADSLEALANLMREHECDCDL